MDGEDREGALHEASNLESLLRFAFELLRIENGMRDELPGSEQTRRRVIDRVGGWVGQGGVIEELPEVSRGVNPFLQPDSGSIEDPWSFAAKAMHHTPVPMLSSTEMDGAKDSIGNPFDSSSPYVLESLNKTLLKFAR